MTVTHLAHHMRKPAQQACHPLMATINLPSCHIHPSGFRVTKSLEKHTDFGGGERAEALASLLSCVDLLDPPVRCSLPANGMPLGGVSCSLGMPTLGLHERLGQPGRKGTGWR